MTVSKGGMLRVHWIVLVERGPRPTILRSSFSEPVALF